MVEEAAAPAAPAAPVEAPTAPGTEEAPAAAEEVKAAPAAPAVEAEEEEEMPELPFEAELSCKGVYLSRVVVQVWFPEPAWKLKGEPEPVIPKDDDAEEEEEEEEEAPPPPEETEAAPSGPKLEVDYALIPKRVAESAAAMALSTAQKEVMKLTAAFDALSAEAEAEEKEAATAAVDVAKEAVAAAEAKYADIKTSFDAEGQFATTQWMGNLLHVAHCGVQTFLVGGRFWPCTDMMSLFTERYHFNECEKMLQVFKTRYGVERDVPITFMNKLVPNIFLEDPMGAPTDITPMLNQMLRNSGQDPEAEDAEVPPRLDALALHWWDMASGDYVRACQTVAAGQKVKAFGLVNCPLPVLKKLHRAGINIATLELQGPLGLLESADSQALLAYCAQHGIKVLLADALVGGLLTPAQLGAAEPAGEKVTAGSPVAHGLHTVAAAGGWARFQTLLTAFDQVAQLKCTTLDTVALRFYINKGVHPIVGIPWGDKCAAAFPDVRKCEANFLTKADMAALSAAF